MVAAALLAAAILARRTHLNRSTIADLIGEVDPIKVAEGRYLVDLPGYGYAKVPEAMREAWKGTINRYFQERASLAGLVVVMDIRHPLRTAAGLWRSKCSASVSAGATAKDTSSSACAFDPRFAGNETDRFRTSSLSTSTVMLPGRLMRCVRRLVHSARLPCSGLKRGE